MEQPFSGSLKTSVLDPKNITLSALAPALEQAGERVAVYPAHDPIYNPVTVS